MAPKNVTLVYFNGRGRAEQIRWVLAQAGVKYEDRRIEFPDWPALKPKSPTGGLPYMIVDGMEFGTSGAVAMHAATAYGLAGSNNLEEAQVHMIWEVVQDAFNESAKQTFEQDPARLAELQKQYNTVTLPKLTKFLAARLTDGKKWLVGDKISMADIVVGSLLEFKLDDTMRLEPTVCALVKRVMNQPNIKKWIASRPESQF